MQQVIINVGVSGAGKTTWSTQYMKKNIGNYRINRDSIRLQLVGTLDDYYQRKDLNYLEKLVTEIEDMQFLSLLEKGASVIIDNTNLKPSYIDRWVDFVYGWNQEKSAIQQVELLFKIFSEANPQTLKKRVNVRDAPLGWDKLAYIDKQVSSLKSVISYIESKHKGKIIG